HRPLLSSSTRRSSDLAEESRIPVILRLCDTMGYGVPYPGAVLPRSVPRLVYAMTHDAGVPEAWLEWHGHNDFYKVLINASTAWLDRKSTRLNSSHVAT